MSDGDEYIDFFKYQVKWSRIPEHVVAHNGIRPVSRGIRHTVYGIRPVSRGVGEEETHI